jgi:hypothetical protein
MGIFDKFKGKLNEIKDKAAKATSKDDKPGLFDVAGRMRMSKAILKLKGKCPECGGSFGMNSKCKNCGLNIQDWAGKQSKDVAKTLEEVNIPNASIKKPVRFLGGHKSAPKPVEGWLGLTPKAVVFKNGLGNNFEIPLKTIERIEIVDDKYTPGVGRALVMGALGGNTESQSFRPHKSALKITYKGETRTKDLEFNFNAITWAGAVEECQEFYSELNAMLD